MAISPNEGFTQAVGNAAVSFVATAFGVLIGIPAALWIDRQTRKRRDRERAKGVLVALKDEINHNLSLLKQIQAELKPDYLIYYNMDLNTWRRTTSLEDFLEIVSHDLLRHLYRIYYEYEHLSRKIDTQFSMNYSVVRAMDGYGKERESIVSAILKHASDLEKESGELAREIDTELSRLS